MEESRALSGSAHTASPVVQGQSCFVSTMPLMHWCPGCCHASLMLGGFSESTLAESGEH